MEFKSFMEARDYRAFRGQGAELRGECCTSPSLGALSVQLADSRHHDRKAPTGAASPQASGLNVDINPSPNSPGPQGHWLPILPE